MMMVMGLMMMIMLMMKLLLMLKFRVSAICGSPCKMFEKWQQRGPPQMPGTMFLPHTQKSTKCPVDFQQNR
jgi:hypothetical protein